MNIAALLWDFDGTILDTMENHFSVNKEMFSLIKPEIKIEQWPEVLSSLEKYIRAEYESTNWIDLYRSYFGFSKTQIDQAGRLWGVLASKNKTSIKIFDGISDVIKKIEVPQGICSQNCSNNIKKKLQEYGISHNFKSIIGHNDISFEKQKPHPEGFLLCVEKMKIRNNGILFYIGDHKEDFKFAKNAEAALKNMGYNFKVLSIAACYGRTNYISCDIVPDYEAYKPSDIFDIIEKHNLAI